MMQKKIKELLLSGLIVMLLSISMSPIVSEAAYNGMSLVEGEWRYVVGGNVDYHYTGMACNEYGWWYYQNGRLDWNYTGMACNEYGWWYYQNGRLDWNYTGMACNEYGWWYYQNGRLNWNYTGMACNEYGWWYYQNGRLDWNYTGMACNEYGWWYYQNGRIDYHFTGMIENEYGWWYFTNGRLDWNYTGMACNEKGWWYFTNGRIDYHYTGMACNEYGWWYFSDGRLDWNYTGIACNEYGQWFYQNGNIDFSYSGTRWFDEREYLIRLGRVKLCLSDTDYSLMSWRENLRRLNYDADVAFFGDSLTANSNFHVYFADTGKKIMGLGRSADTITEMTRRVDMLQMVKPETVYVMGGINEILDNDLPFSVNEYRKLLEEIHRTLPNAEICVQSVLPISKTKEKEYISNAGIERFNRELQKLVAEKQQEGYQISYIDLHSLFIKNGAMNPQYTTDGVHLNDAGYQVWGECISVHEVWQN